MFEVENLFGDFGRVHAQVVGHNVVDGALQLVVATVQPSLLDSEFVNRVLVVGRPATVQQLIPLQTTPTQ